MFGNAALTIKLKFSVGHFSFSRGFVMSACVFLSVVRFINIVGNYLKLIHILITYRNVFLFQRYNERPKSNPLISLKFLYVKIS